VSVPENDTWRRQADLDPKEDTILVGTPAFKIEMVKEFECRDDCRSVTVLLIV
jgi:hypothetical protein